MKATVNGIQLEGTAEEIHEYVRLGNVTSDNGGKISTGTITFDKNKFYWQSLENQTMI